MECNLQDQVQWILMTTKVETYQTRFLNCTYTKVFSSIFYIKGVKASKFFKGCDKVVNI